MRPSRDAALFSLGLAVLLAIPSWGQQKRAITPSDCVTVRDLQHDDSTWRSTIKISPDSSRIAYPVRTPNLATNENDIELYVRLVSEDPGHSGRPLLVGDISAMRWTADSKHLTMLVKDNGRRVVERVDAQTGEREILVRADTDIAEYSIDRDGTTIVYAIDEPTTDSKDGPRPEEVATGFRIPFQVSGDIYARRRRLLVTRQSQTGWTTPEPIIIQSPLSQLPLPALPYVENAQLQPMLSPNGKALLVVYDDYSEEMPEEWRRSAFMQLRSTAGIVQLFHVLVLYDLSEKKTTAPLKSPYVYSAAVWSSDSKSFVVAAYAPVSSDLEKEDVQSQRIGSSSGAHLFWVEAGTGKVEEVAPKLSYPWEVRPWNRSGHHQPFFAQRRTMERGIVVPASTPGQRSTGD